MIQTSKHAHKIKYYDIRNLNTHTSQKYKGLKETIVEAEHYYSVVNWFINAEHSSLFRPQADTLLIQYIISGWSCIFHGSLSRDMDCL